jgi:hypothetical protein
MDILTVTQKGLGGAYDILTLQYMRESYLGKTVFALRYTRLVPQGQVGHMSGTLSVCGSLSGEQILQNAENYYVHSLYIS